MGYSDFFNREDVYMIIKDTISSHYNTKVSIINSMDKINSENLYFCLPKLNIIYRSTFSKSITKKFLISNMIGNQNSITKFLIRLYISVSLSFPGIFSDKFIYIEHNNNIDIIYPGNKKLKILDFSNQKIINILKNRFSNEWFMNEIYFRINSNFNFVLNIDEYGESYYIEKILIGKPLARLKNTQNEKILIEINNYMDMLADNKKTINFIEYAKKLSLDIIGIFEAINGQSRNNQFYLDNVYRLHMLILERLCLLNSNYTLNIQTTHGDLQKGNVFIDENGKIYILDWETVGIRFDKYDKFIFKYSFRNSYNLVSNLRRYINKEGMSQNSLIDLYVFLLEDLKWYLQESTQLLKGSISIGVQNYGKPELYKFIDNLESAEV